MKYNKRQRNRWKRIMALLLSAAMLTPAAPGTVYALESPNDGQILEDRVLETAGADESGDAGDEENKHVHSWIYKKVPDDVPEGGAQEITASGCQVSGCSFSESQVRLTLQVTGSAKRKGSVLADGVELLSDNDWDIPYEIKYYRNDPENGGLVEWTEDAPPKDPGKYEVRAIFAGQENLYLKVDYAIGGIHKHQWNYEGVPTGNSASGQIVCSGNADGSVCAVSQNVNLTIKVEAENGNKVTLLANGEELTHDHALKIPYEIKYYQNGIEVGTEKKPPKNSGKYKVRAIFDETHCLETDYIVAAVHECKWEYKKEGTNTVKAVCKGAGGCKEGEWIEITLNVKKKSAYERNPKTNRALLSARNKNGSLSLEEVEKFGISKLTYYKDEKGKPGNLIGNREPKNAGTYHVQLTVGNKKTVTIKNVFTISKAKRKNIKVKMGNYELKQKSPEPELNQELEKSAKPVYYYVNAKKKDKKPWKSKKPTKAGNYYMFVALKETVNYEKYQTPKEEWKKFTVYSDHKWKNMPEALTLEEQSAKITCIRCKKTKTVTLPKQTVSVDLGKSQSLVSKNTGCTFTSKAKGNYYTLSSKGKIKIKNDPAYYKKNIPVKVKVSDKIYTMNVKAKIPAPKVKILIKKVKHGEVWGYRFKFQYNVVEADGITVDMVEGSTANIERDLKKYVHTPYATRDSYIDLSDSFLQGLGYEMQFKITANYGRNKSTPTIIKLTGTKVDKDKHKWKEERVE